MRQYLLALAVAMWGTTTWSACTLRHAQPIEAGHVDCAAARPAAIETLRGLGYAVVGTYEPVPGRTSIIAAEKTTPTATFHSNVTITCQDNRVDVTPAQPSLAWHDPHFEEDFRTGWHERTGGIVRPTLASTGSIEVARSATAAGIVQAPAAGVAASAPPAIRFDVLSAAETRQRFGGDLSAAGVQAARIAIANRTPRTYIVSTPLLRLRRVSGELVAPLSWSAASTRIAKSAAGRGWKTYDEIKGDLVVDQILRPNSDLNGMLLFPSGNYTSVQVLLIDQQSAQSERFEGVVPQGSLAPVIMPPVP